ncbi:unnamed protein product [Mytilus coruscus]|uniref:Reverse transcriptase zinc-binding domain-containing protein n=1 Tax=Mytilus coruscus TaxID=42192 RepID=A0A6J8AJ08_MYTCO|nr:unnamed protein product [Mytilus coruscus]
MYNLPFFLELFEKKYTKIEWKRLTKSATNEHWTNKLRLECEEKSTLQNLAISNLGIGVTHPVWATVSSSVSDIRKAITKSRMLTGIYLLQAHRHRFNQAEVDPICPNCRTETEDLCHVLTICLLYMNIRIALYTPIKNFMLSIISETKWTTHFSNRDAICTLKVDCQNITNLGIIPNNPEILGKIENMSRIYCYEIHKKEIIHRDITLPWSTQLPIKTPITIFTTMCQLKLLQNFEMEQNEFPVRFGMDDPNTTWRHGKPDYTVVNNKYMREKSKNHQTGSLEKTVENLVKSWEMESTHKSDLKVVLTYIVTIVNP